MCNEEGSLFNAMELFISLLTSLAVVVVVVLVLVLVLYCFIFVLLSLFW